MRARPKRASSCPTAGRLKPAGRPCPPGRPAAEHHPAGRQPARPGRHQRLQRPRAVAHRPRRAEGRRSPGSPQSWFGLAATPEATGSGGRAAAATCSTPSAWRIAIWPASAPPSPRPRPPGPASHAISARAGRRSQRQGALLARHRRRHDLRVDLDRSEGAQVRTGRERGPTTSSFARTASSCSSPTGPAAPCWCSTRPTSAPSPGSPSASTPTRSPSIPDDDRIFVACASSNCVSVIDTRRGIVTETIHTALFPMAPEGSTPDALAVAPDGKTLYVANADNNCVAVIDIAAPEPQPGQGLHPHRLVSDRRGGHARRQDTPGRRRQGEPDQGQPDRHRPSRTSRSEAARAARRRSRPFPYIGTTLSGSLSIVPVPDDKTLAALHRDGLQELPVLRQAAHRRPLPREDGDPDQGRRPVADQACDLHHQGEPDLRPGLRRHDARQRRPVAGDVRREVTPNHHKLAEEFVLLDNLYCNGHVSADGHPWSTMAYNTDYIARNWALTYSSRAGIDDDDDGDLSTPPRATSGTPAPGQGSRYRSYGEYGRRVSQPDGSFRMEGARPGPGRPHVPRLRHRQGPAAAAPATPTTPTPSSGNSASSRRTASCRGSWS